MRNNGLVSLFVSFLWLASFVFAQNPTTSAPSATSQPPPPTATGTAQPTSGGSTASGTSAAPTSTSTGGSGGGGGGGGGSNPNSGPPDVHLKVPELSVGRIELDVDDLRADVDLSAEIANLVTLNAGVQVGVKKVNITIADVRAELELTIRLGHLVEIVNRTLHTLDLNPLLVNVLNEVGDLVGTVVGAVDSLLGSVLQGKNKLNFIIDNLGNIVQELVTDTGETVSTIVGSYTKNMTFTGQQKTLDHGLIQKTYQYSPLGALVNVITNSLGQVVQAVVVKGGSTGGGGGGGGGGGTSTRTATTEQPTTQQPTSAATQSA